jgi:hypothetical protein
MTKESQRERGTHVLSNPEGETSRNGETKPASEGYSLSVERRAMDNSRYQTRTREQSEYTAVSQAVGIR